MRKISKSRAKDEGFTNFSSVLPTYQVVYYCGKPIEKHVLLLLWNNFQINTNTNASEFSRDSSYQAKRPIKTIVQAKSHLMKPNRVKKSNKNNIFSTIEKTINWTQFTISLKTKVFCSKRKRQRLRFWVTRSWLVSLDVDIFSFTWRRHVAGRGCFLLRNGRIDGWNLPLTKWRPKSFSRWFN